MNKMQLSKLDCARRQLETAIILYMNDKDPVSIHTLAGASHQLISDLRDNKYDVPLTLDGSIVKEEFREEFISNVRKAINFFKHANRDKTEIIKFNPELNDFHIFDACEGYQLLTGEKYPYFIIFRGWYHHKYPDVLNNTLARDTIINHYGGDKLKYFTSLLSVSSILK